MPTQTVRISVETHRSLKALSAADGRSLQDELDRAVEWQRHHRFLEEANAAFADLRSSGEGWREELAARERWDAALGDGLSSP